jgi:hypothetical protein
MRSNADADTVVGTKRLVDASRRQLAKAFDRSRMACSNCAIRTISLWAPTFEYETRLQIVDIEVAKLLDGSRLVVELTLFGRISPAPP